MLAEKRTQAIKIAEAMGWPCIRPQTKINGTLNGQPLTLCWAAGHLLEYAPVERMTQITEIVSEPELVPLSDGNQYTGSRKASSYLDTIQQLIKKAEEIIIATDPDREGEAIAYNILNYFGCVLTVQRLWLAEGLSRSAIRKAMKHLLPAHKTKSLYRASQARSLSDWYFIFLSIGYTRLNRYENGVTSVGRVQTPTLNLVVQRDQEVRKHHAKAYYQIAFTFDTGEECFNCRYPPMNSGDDGTTLDDPVQLHLILSTLKQVNEADVVEQLTTTPIEGESTQPHSLSSLQKRLTLETQSIHKSQKSAEQLYRKGLISYPRTTQQQTTTTIDHSFVSPPKPHSLVSLHGALQQQFSHTANRSNQLIQRLYDLGLISYPRTPSQELPPDHIHSPEQHATLKNLSQVPELSTQAKRCRNQPTDIHLPLSDNHSHTTAHWGIIPTSRPPQLQLLTHRERSAYLEICRRYLQALYPPATLNQQTLQITIILPTGKELKLSHQRTQIKEPGWTAAFGHSIDEQPPIKLRGSQLKINQFTLIEKQTEPPPHYNDYTLLLAMEQAGKHSTGIGTPATRAGTIELLIKRGYIRRIGTSLQSTTRGASLIQQVPAWLRSPNTTSQWEGLLNQIASTENDKTAVEMRNQFISQQKKKIIQLLDRIQPLLTNANQSQPSNFPSEKMVRYAEILSRRKRARLPGRYKTDWKICRDFIENHQ
jgi:DNA topoisomerase III